MWNELCEHEAMALTWNPKRRHMFISEFEAYGTWDLKTGIVLELGPFSGNYGQRFLDKLDRSSHMILLGESQYMVSRMSENEVRVWSKNVDDDDTQWLSGPAALKPKSI